LWEWKRGGELSLNTSFAGERIEGADIAADGTVFLADLSGYYHVRYDDTSGVKRVQVNGIAVAVAANGVFSTELNLVEGHNTITVNARENTGETAELTFTALCDMRPPFVEIVEPKIRDVRGIVNIDQEIITIRGSVIDESGIKDITLNGRSVEMDSRTSFWKELNLAEGENEVVIAAEDSAGNATEKRVRIKHSRPVPTTEFLKGRSYALIIGIDKYRGEWQPLKNAVRDAKAVEAEASRLDMYCLLQMLVSLETSSKGSPTLFLMRTRPHITRRYTRASREKLSLPAVWSRCSMVEKMDIPSSTTIS
jgi:hypothetical protein